MRQICFLWHEKIQEILKQKFTVKTINFNHHKEGRRYYMHLNMVQSISCLMLVKAGF